MSIQTEITRLSDARNTLRNKAVNLGIATGTDKLDVLAEKFGAIVNNGSIDATVKEGETYTIPKGYHDGSGTVSGVSGGGNYSLQTKSVTPTKAQQSVSADAGYYGLSAVTVAAIPDQYQDVSATTATAADVLATKVFINATGETTAGTMPNNGVVSKVLDATTSSYTIPKGYHNGSGSVSISLEEKSAAPSRSEQEIVPTTGKVLSKVTISAIPSNLQDVSGVTATAAGVLTGQAFVNSSGALTQGTMTNVGSHTATIDGLTETSVTIPAGYHDGTGTVSLTSDIEDALAAI